MALVRIELPVHLCRLASPHPETQIRELELSVPRPVTQRSVLDALEADYPALRGTLRDQTTRLRRPFIRFFACSEDVSHLPPDQPLPPEIADGLEPLLVVGAIAGG